MRIKAKCAAPKGFGTIVVLSSQAAKMLQRPYRDSWKLPEA